MCPVPVHDVAVGLLLLILATLVSFFRGLRLSSHIYTSALRATVKASSVSQMAKFLQDQFGIRGGYMTNAGN